MKRIVGAALAALIFLGCHAAPATEVIELPVKSEGFQPAADYEPITTNPPVTPSIVHDGEHWRDGDGNLFDSAWGAWRENDSGAWMVMTQDGWVDVRPTPTPETAASSTRSGQIPAVGAAAVPGVEQWRALVSAYLVDPDGWLRRMGCESGGRANAHNINPATGDDSVGLFQINLAGGNLAGRIRQLQSLGYDVYDRASAVAVLMQPEANIRMTALLSGGGHQTGQWSCK